MNKSVVVHQLQLPQDAIEHICRFIFYTVEECIEKNKNKFKKVLLDVKNDVRIEHVPFYSGNNVMYFMTFQFPIRHHKVIYTNLCGTCGNFIILRNCNSFRCRCFY
jgi:hypothetical protein